MIVSTGKGVCGKRIGPCRSARSIPQSAHGWKGGRSWVHLKRTIQAEEEPDDHKRQEQKEDRIEAKSKPTVMDLASTVSTSSSSLNHPIVSRSLGILKLSRARRNSKPDAASSSQVRLTDACLGGLMVDVTGETRCSRERPGIRASKHTGSERLDSLKKSLWKKHNLSISPEYVPHLENSTRSCERFTV